MRYLDLVLAFSKPKKAPLRDEQVNVAQSQLLETRPQSTGNVGNVADDLGGDEELFPSYTSLLEPCTELGLRLVDLGAILVVVAKTKRHLDTIYASLIDFAFITTFIPGCTGAVPELEISLAKRRATDSRILPLGCCCHR